MEATAVGLLTTYAKPIVNTCFCYFDYKNRNAKTAAAEVLTTEALYQIYS